MFPVSRITFPRVDTRVSSLSHSWHHFVPEPPSASWDQQTLADVTRHVSPVTKLSHRVFPGPRLSPHWPRVPGVRGSGVRTLDRRRPGPGTIRGAATLGHCVVVNFIFLPEGNIKNFLRVSLMQILQLVAPSPYICLMVVRCLKILNFVNEVLKLGPAIIRPQIAPGWWWKLTKLQQLSYCSNKVSDLIAI